MEHVVNECMRAVAVISGMMLTITSYAATPVWSFSPLTATQITIDTSSTAMVQYQVTNHSRKAHTLMMRPVAGINASGCENALGYNQSCTLSLAINGNALLGDIVGGPVLCDHGNMNQCYQPSGANIMQIHRASNPPAKTISLSVDALALSVKCPSDSTAPSCSAYNDALTGVARKIIIANSGPLPVSSIAATPNSSFPSDTNIDTSNCSAGIAPESSCEIIITPGPTASNDAGGQPCTLSGALPASKLTITADNNFSQTIPVVVVGYRCQHQGGLIFDVDDSTPETGSIGGKVASLEDQTTSIIWSSNGSSGTCPNPPTVCDVSDDDIPGIAQTSSPSAGIPQFSDFESMFNFVYTNALSLTSSDFEQCAGNADGACNSRNILTFYNTYVTNYSATGALPFTATAGPTNPAYYAAGLCTQTIAGYSDWYLPAICELGYLVNESSGNSECRTSAQPLLQNMQSNLVDNNESSLAGHYWSSTEHYPFTQDRSWYQDFAAGTSGNQGVKLKDDHALVRCVRGLTP